MELMTNGQKSLKMSLMAQNAQLWSPYLRVIGFPKNKAALCSYVVLCTIVNVMILLFFWYKMRQAALMLYSSIHSLRLILLSVLRSMPLQGAAAAAAADDAASSADEDSSGTS